MRQDDALYLPALRRMLAATIAVVLLCHVLLSGYAWTLAGQFLVPSLERKAHNTGLAIARNLTRALSAGVPWDRMEGIQQYFDQVLAGNPDLAYIILTDGDGKLLVRAGHGGEVVAPEQYVSSTRNVERRYVTYAQVHVGVDRRFISAGLAPLRQDLVLLAAGSLLLAFMLASFAASLRFAAPLRQLGALLSRMSVGDYRYRAPASPGAALSAGANRVQSRLNHAFFELSQQAAEQRRWAGAQPVIKRLRSMYRFADGGYARELLQDRSMVARALAFAFLFAEALMRPLLPAYAAALPPLIGNPALAQALPLSAAFAGFALAQPLARDWASAAGRRSSYVAGTLVAALALAAAAWVPDYAVLVVARATAGVGYALMYVACLPAAADTSERRGGQAGLAVFGIALVFAEACGPAFGGLLGGSLGARNVFVLAALVMPLAALVALALLEEDTEAPAHRNVIMLPAPALPRAVTGHARRALLLSLVVGTAQAFLLGALFAFLVPAWLDRMHHAAAGIARFYLAWGLAALLCAPLFLRMAFRSAAYAWLTVLGAALALAGALPFSAGGTHRAQLIGLALLGCGTLLCASAQLLASSRALRAARLRHGHFGDPPLFSALKGAALAAGPLAAALASTLWGTERAVLALALLVAAAACAFGAAFIGVAPRRPA